MTDATNFHAAYVIESLIINYIGGCLKNISYFVWGSTNLLYRAGNFNPLQNILLSTRHTSLIVESIQYL